MNNQPRPQLVDGVRPRTVARPSGPVSAQSVAAPVATQSIPLLHKRTFTPPTPPKERRWLKRLQLPLIIIAAMGGGLLVQNIAIGVSLSAAYGLAALIWRIPSRSTFALATLSLAAVCLLLLFKPNGELISNFSTYTFIFLIIGVLSLTKESRMPQRKHRHR